MSAENEQRLVDIAEHLQEAVGSISQLLAELGDSREEMTAALEKAAGMLVKAMPAGKMDTQAIARAIIDGLKAMKLPAPQVTVQAANVEFNPVINVPAQDPPVVNIDSAREWTATHTYDEYNRCVESRLVRVK